MTQEDKVISMMLDGYSVDEISIACGIYVNEAKRIIRQYGEQVAGEQETDSNIDNVRFSIYQKFKVKQLISNYLRQTRLSITDDQKKRMKERLFYKIDREL